MHLPLSRPGGNQTTTFQHSSSQAVHDEVESHIYYKYEGKKTMEIDIQESHTMVQCDKMVELLGVC